jgi:hypothetical protein
VKIDDTIAAVCPTGFDDVTCETMRDAPSRTTVYAFRRDRDSYYLPVTDEQVARMNQEQLAARLRWAARARTDLESRTAAAILIGADDSDFEHIESVTAIYDYTRMSLDLTVMLAGQKLKFQIDEEEMFYGDLDEAESLAWATLTARCGS